MLLLNGFALVVCIVCLAQTAQAQALPASAEVIAAKLMAALGDPEVQAGSTTPHLPLMSSDNRLEQLLVTTPKVVAGMREAVLSAKREILLEIYEWNAEDEATQSVMDALWRRSLRALDADEAPLHVRVIVSATFWAENDNSQTDLKDLIDYVAEHPRAPNRLAIELSRWRAGAPHR